MRKKLLLQVKRSILVKRVNTYKGMKALNNILHSTAISMSRHEWSVCVVPFSVLDPKQYQSQSRVLV
jgi:hypothetical protein